MRITGHTTLRNVAVISADLTSQEGVRDMCGAYVLIVSDDGDSVVIDPRGNHHVIPVFLTNDFKRLGNEILFAAAERLQR